MAIIGIDLGTTNSLVCVYRNGKAEILPNSMGEYTTPSVISIDENGEILTGAIAAERLISHPSKTVSEFKRSMGLQTGITLDGRAFSPEELSALLLKKLRQDAAAALGEDIEEAVISVPAYFDDNSRSATKLAANLAGLKCERLVNEPSAAALCYQAEHDFQSGTFMIIDFGGGTLDVSLVDSFDGVIEIIAVAGDNKLGGKDFNNAIAESFCRENGFAFSSLPPDEQAAVYKSAESCKIALTSSPAAFMSVAVGGKQFSLSLDNNRLIAIAPQVFERIAIPIRKVLKDGRMDIDDVDDIILVGGSCKMPTVRAYIERLTGKKPCTDTDPDKAIAMGAGIFAAIKDRNDELRDVVMTDICPFSLGISVLDTNTNESIMSFIIERNTVLPSSRSMRYCPASDMQTRSVIKIYQGERINPEKNLFLGSLEVDYPPCMSDTPAFTVKMTYDINGILIVDTEIIATGKTYKKIILNQKSGMSDSEAKAAVKRLSELVLAPADKEENRMLIARAERVYEESLSTDRRIIGELLGHFKSALNNGNSREIRENGKRLSDLLDRLEL